MILSTVLVLLLASQIVIGFSADSGSRADSDTGSTRKVNEERFLLPLGIMSLWKRRPLYKTFNGYGSFGGTFGATFGGGSLYNGFAPFPGAAGFGVGGVGIAPGGVPPLGYRYPYTANGGSAPFNLKRNDSLDKRRTSKRCRDFETTGAQDCAPDQQCNGGQCVHSCSPSPCGHRAECRARNHRAVCSCPANMVGDPMVSCQTKQVETISLVVNGTIIQKIEMVPSIQKADVCKPSPCGANTDCKVENERPVCTCKPGYQGNPLLSCRHECESDYECSASQNCRDFRCQSVCTPAACGEGANCAAVNHTASCTCPQNYLGDAHTRCYPECTTTDDCPDYLACDENLKCVNPCTGACGENADCIVQGHTPICSCPQNMTGDPFVRCEPVAYDVCKPSPCGANTDCKVENERPVCTCKPGYQGNPLSSCRHECESDYECSASQNCRDFHCQSVCTPGACGEGANCAAVNHTASCTCAQNYLGDAHTRCYPECTTNDDCPDYLACDENLKCVNPCTGACGENADCTVQGHTPICSCPQNMTGDPFVRCEPVVFDLCQPNPCGNQAQCTPSYDVTGGERPVCTCPPGYIGDPLSNCQRGECQANSDCPANRACFDSQCINPCVKHQCGTGAYCGARNRAAVCSCPSGYRGDPLVSCTLVKNIAQDLAEDLVRILNTSR